MDDVKVAIVELRTGVRLDGSRNKTFVMRPEQQHAVERTMDYFVLAKVTIGSCAKFYGIARCVLGRLCRLSAC